MTENGGKHETNGRLKTRTWILLFGVFAVLCAAAILWMNGFSKGSVAEIVQNGVTVRRIDLSRVTAAETFTVEDGEGGYNVITVEPGRIAVSDANCRDRVCVHYGWLSKSRIPILCIPHKLMIRISGSDGGPDAVSY